MFQNFQPRAFRSPRHFGNTSIRLFKVIYSHILNSMVPSTDAGSQEHWNPWPWIAMFFFVSHLMAFLVAYLIGKQANKALYQKVVEEKEAENEELYGKWQSMIDIHCPNTEQREQVLHAGKSAPGTTAHSTCSVSDDNQTGVSLRRAHALLTRCMSALDQPTQNVFIAPSGEAFHRTASCSHLGKARKVSERHPCPFCHRSITQRLALQSDIKQFVEGLRVYSEML